MTQSVIKPRAPQGRSWSCMGSSAAVESMGFPSAIYRHAATGLTVISAVEVAVDDAGHSNGPEYHVSVSKDGKRCSSAEARMVCIAFGIDGAIEDNHVPDGKVRNFWRPVAENLIGIKCRCEASENAIVEDKGEYVWRT